MMYRMSRWPLTWVSGPTFYSLIVMWPEGVYWEPLILIRRHVFKFQVFNSSHLQNSYKGLHIHKTSQHPRTWLNQGNAGKQVTSVSASQHCQPSGQCCSIIKSLSPWLNRQADALHLWAPNIQLLFPPLAWIFARRLPIGWIHNVRESGAASVLTPRFSKREGR